MDKFQATGSNTHIVVFLLLLVGIGFCLNVPSPCKAANLTEEYQVTSTIELAAPLPSSQITVEDVKIQNVLNMSYICINGEDSPLPWNISEGKLAWKPQNVTVQSATISDNLGDNFPTLNYSNVYVSPQLNGTIPPNSSYVLSMVIVLNPGALYVDAYKAWEFGTTFITNLPLNTTILFPINFSVPYYGSGAAYSRDQYHKILTWNNSQQKPLNISATFLPFLYSPETIFLNFSEDISSVFPIFAGSTATMTEEFTSLAEYNGLSAPHIFGVIIPFPPSGNDTQVESVRDINGTCEKLPFELSDINYAYSGSFYPDYENQEVIIYPRVWVVENRYDYVVSVTFDLSSNSPSNATFGLLWPYDSAVRSTINLKSSGDWQVNLTQYTIVEFWLPQGTEPYSRPDYHIYYDIGTGRYLVRFVNASSEWTTGTWEIDFNITRLFNFFWTGVSSIILLLIALCIMIGFRKHPSNRILKGFAKILISKNIFPLISGFVFVAAELAIANDWTWSILTHKIVFTLILMVQVALTILVIVLGEKLEFGSTRSRRPALFE